MKKEGNKEKENHNHEISGGGEYARSLIESIHLEEFVKKLFLLF